MARLTTAGAELQAVVSLVEYTAGVVTQPALETSTKRSGNAAWRISNAAAVEGFRIAHSSAQGSFFFRFYLYIVAMPSATRVIGGARITGSMKISIRLTAAGALQLYNSEDGAQVGSDSSALSLATWYRIELNYDSTTLSATTCEAKLDGTTFASGTIDLAATITAFGCYTDVADATLDYIVDDLAINDASGSFENTWPGEGEVIALRPNGAGDNTAWTRGGTDTGANWSQVNEAPPDSAQYVESNTSGQIDDYEMEDTPAALESTDTINVVHVGVYAAVSDATASDPDIALRIKSASGGTVEESASLDVNSVTYNGPSPLPAGSDNCYKLTLYDLPGASTSAWTKSTLDTMQAGIREAVTDAHFARVAALWVTVDHKPGGAPASIVHPIFANDDIHGVMFGGQVVR